MLNTKQRLKTMMLMWITAMMFNRIVSAQESDFSQPDPLITADVGENVILRCFRLDKFGSVIWYQQKVGHKPRIIVAVQNEPSYENEFKPPKFHIKADSTSCHLNICNVGPSDEAMYYCGYRKYLTWFGNGTFLKVKNDGGVKVSVVQRGVWDSVPAGASVTLQCSVLSESRAAELRVFWFRAASTQSHPQIIYTHHNSSQQCESASSTHTCVYNFSKNILNLNDTGTYYCAVALCGTIVFGNGTRVQLETERSVDPVVICLVAALAVCVVVIFALIFVLTYKWRNCEQGSGILNPGSVTDKILDKACDNEELNYAALHFNARRAKRGKVQKNQPKDIIYSDVRSRSIT